MKKDLLNILCCPICKGPLTPEIESEESHEIIRGTLYCVACNVYYPIDEGIPNLLPPEVR